MTAQILAEPAVSSQSHCPLRSPDVEAHRVIERGDEVVVLKHRSRRTYLRLSSASRFVWEHCSGDQGEVEIAAHLLACDRPRDAAMVRGAIEGLTSGGYLLRSGNAQPSVRPPAPLAPPTLLMRLALLLNKRWMFRDVHRYFDALYRYGGFVLFTSWFQVLVGMANAVGLIVYLLSLRYAAMAPSAATACAMWIVVPITLLMHEASHGLTVRHFGREVNGAGVAWFWVGPVPFVDTSDMWIAPRWHRIAVSLAGPYCNLTIGAAAALFACNAPLEFRPFFMFLSTAMYLSVLTNLCPMLEFDGYYALADFLEYPNLRRRAIAWVMHDFPRSWRQHGILRRRRIELCYVVSSFIFIFLNSILEVGFGHAIFFEWLSSAAMPAVAAHIGAWILPVALCLAFWIALFGEIQIILRSSHSRPPSPS